ncbi:MAG: hypothetical protein V3R99_01310 [Thermoguttaceae bacterium]
MEIDVVVILFFSCDSAVSRPSCDTERTAPSAVAGGVFREFATVFGDEPGRMRVVGLPTVTLPSADVKRTISVTSVLGPPDLSQGTQML